MGLTVVPEPQQPGEVELSAPDALPQQPDPRVVRAQFEQIPEVVEAFPGRPVDGEGVAAVIRCRGPYLNVQVCRMREDARVSRVYIEAQAEDMWCLLHEPFWLTQEWAQLKRVCVPPGLVVRVRLEHGDPTSVWVCLWHAEG